MIFESQYTLKQCKDMQATVDVNPDGIRWIIRVDLIGLTNANDN